MAVENAYKLDSVSVYVPGTVASGGINEELLGEAPTSTKPMHIGAVTDSNLALNTVTQADDSGGVYDEFRTVIQQQPVTTFTTKDIRDALAITSTTGTCFVGTSATEGVRLGLAQADPCSGRFARSTSNHAVYTLQVGTLVPESLTAAAGQDAEISMAAHARRTDTVLAPMSWLYDTTLPEVAAHPLSWEAGQWTLGACAIAIDTTGDDEPEHYYLLDDCSSVRIDFGIQLSKRDSPGTLYPRIITIDKIQPTITIDTRELAVFHYTGGQGVKALGDLAVQGSGVVNTQIQLRKRLTYGATAANEGFVADATQEHINFLVKGYIHAVTPVSASGSEDAEVSLEIQGLTDSAGVRPIVEDLSHPYETDPTSE